MSERSASEEDASSANGSSGMGSHKGKLLRHWDSPDDETRSDEMSDTPNVVPKVERKPLLRPSQRDGSRPIRRRREANFRSTRVPLLISKQENALLQKKAEVDELLKTHAMVRNRNMAAVRQPLMRRRPTSDSNTASSSGGPAATTANTMEPEVTGSVNLLAQVDFREIDEAVIPDRSHLSLQAQITELKKDHEHFSNMHADVVFKLVRDHCLSWEDSHMAFMGEMIDAHWKDLHDWKRSFLRELTAANKEDMNALAEALEQGMTEQKSIRDAMRADIIHFTNAFTEQQNNVKALNDKVNELTKKIEDLKLKMG